MREYFKYALLAFLLSVALKMVIFYTDPLQDGWGRAYIFIAPIALLLFIPIAVWRTRQVEFEGYASGRINAAAGVRVVIIVAILNALFDYIYLSAINTEVIPHIAQQIHDLIDKSPMVPSEKARAHDDIKQSATVTRHVIINNMIVISVGFFLTFLSALFLRKTKDGKPLFSLKGQ